MTERPELSTFTAPVHLDQIGDEPVTKRLEADEADRATLAAFLDIPAITSLAGEASILRSGSLLTVTGHLDAVLERMCVASLEPMTETIGEDFAVTFTQDAEAPDEDEEVEIDLDAPEPLWGASLDLGDVLIEQLVLSMDPHPRKEDAEPVADPKAGEKISPFAVLGQLKDKG